MGNRAGLPPRRHCLLSNSYITYGARVRNNTAATYRGHVAKIVEVRVFDPSVTYLRHVIRRGPLEVERRNFITIERARPPTNQTELRYFLQICNMYRRFVQGFAKIAVPLNEKTSKDQANKFEALTDTEYAAFEELKRRLVSSPILTLPRYGRKYTLHTEACGPQVGCALLQEQPEVGTGPLGYWSRALTDAERNYMTSKKKCLAVAGASSRYGRTYTEADSTSGRITRPYAGSSI